MYACVLVHAILGINTVVCVPPLSDSIMFVEEGKIDKSIIWLIFFVKLASQFKYSLHYVFASTYAFM